MCLLLTLFSGGGGVSHASPYMFKADGLSDRNNFISKTVGPLPHNYTWCSFDNWHLTTAKRVCSDLLLYLHEMVVFTMCFCTFTDAEWNRLVNLSMYSGGGRKPSALVGEKDRCRGRSWFLHSVFLLNTFPFGNVNSCTFLQNTYVR